MSFTPSVRPFTGVPGLEVPRPARDLRLVAVRRRRRRRVDATRPARRGRLGGPRSPASPLFVATLGPERLGPFRWPFRLVPFALILLTIATVVVLERAFRAPRRETRDRRRRPGRRGRRAHRALVPDPRQRSSLPLVTAVVLVAGVPFVAVVRPSTAAARARRRPASPSTLGVWVAIVLRQPGDHRPHRPQRARRADRRRARPICAADRPPDAAADPEHARRPTSATVLANDYSLYGTDEAEVINGYTSLVPDGLGAAAVPHRHRLRVRRGAGGALRATSRRPACATSTCSASARSWSSGARCSSASNRSARRSGPPVAEAE